MVAYRDALAAINRVDEATHPAEATVRPCEVTSRCRTSWAFAWWEGDLTTGDQSRQPPPFHRDLPVSLKASTAKLDIFPGQNDELPKNASVEAGPVRVTGDHDGGYRKMA